MRLKPSAPVRNVTEIGAGDYIKVGSQWKRIADNTAEGQSRTPRTWTVRTENGGCHGMFSIHRYAKAEDLT